MGRAKAWLPFGPELMLQRVVRVLREVVEPVVVVAAAGQDVPALPADVRIVRDDIEGKGPLAGLAAGLGALEGQVEAAYLSSCDVPFLKPEFVRRVLSYLTPDASVPAPDLAIPQVDGYYHPLAAVYRVAVLSQVLEMLAADRLRPVFLFDAIRTRIIEPHEIADIDSAFTSLRNLNTPEEYEVALRDLERRGS